MVPKPISANILMVQNETVYMNTYMIYIYIYMYVYIYLYIYIYIYITYTNIYVSRVFTSGG